MKFLRLLVLPFAFLAVVVIRLLGHWGLFIRFGELWGNRIGHLAANTEVYLCQKDAGLHPGIHIWLNNQPVCNEQLMKMWGRVLTIDQTGFFKMVRLVNSFFKGHQKYQVEPVQLDRDIFNHLEKTQPHLQFTAEEEAKGEAQLREWGIPEGAKWVCLIVRDGAYLPELGYHSFRDSDIGVYSVAIQALAERGYYIFRMGAKVGLPLQTYHWRAFDYATNGMRSDFMDIYLAAKCEFCVSTGTGLDAIPYIFRKPICYVNYVPTEYLFTFYLNSLAIWKHHYKDGKRMTFPEIIGSGAGQFFRADEFEEAGITLRGNTPEEIRDLVIEHVDRSMHVRSMNNYWQEMYSFEDEERQREFWKSFPRSFSPYNNKPLHGEIRMRIGREFLKCDQSS